ncbi:hypothetical protein WN51_07933 [Melipona quadrifasciata]|uniref:Uncharacterized protein n=1 Tax=Melipona quadrifasciata TaxID=166423 RepID=A0A0M8ZR57_9HYME|nr:hypothetical protein WN51_07933 [Melipona quadrifasciata]
MAMKKKYNYTIQFESKQVQMRLSFSDFNLVIKPSKQVAPLRRSLEIAPGNKELGFFLPSEDEEFRIGSTIAGSFSAGREGNPKSEIRNPKSGFARIPPPQFSITNTGTERKTKEEEEEQEEEEQEEEEEEEKNSGLLLAYYGPPTEDTGHRTVLQYLVAFNYNRCLQCGKIFKNWNVSSDDFEKSGLILWQSSLSLVVCVEGFLLQVAQITLYMIPILCTSRYIGFFDPDTASLTRRTPRALPFEAGRSLLKGPGVHWLVVIDRVPPIHYRRNCDMLELARNASY